MGTLILVLDIYFGNLPDCSAVVNLPVTVFTNQLYCLENIRKQWQNEMFLLFGLSE